MKNWEKYEKEINEIGVNLLGVTDGEPVKCASIVCSACDFNERIAMSKSCSHMRTEWLYQDDEIRVGDVVKHDLTGTLMYVTQLNDDTRISGVVIDTSFKNIGQAYTKTITTNWTKTTKHIPLDKVIEFIGGDQ